MPEYQNDRRNALNLDQIMTVVGPDLTSGNPSLRVLEKHKGINSLNDCLEIFACNPGPSGACIEYLIRGKEGPINNHPIPSVYIKFQNGNPNTEGANGITQEALTTVLIDRFESFEAGMFACEENALVLHHLQRALWYMTVRSHRRIVEGKEGTLQV
jgi:hypothetical protein